MCKPGFSVVCADLLLLLLLLPAEAMKTSLHATSQDRQASQVHGGAAKHTAQLN